MSFYKKNLGLIITAILLLAALSAGLVFLGKKQAGRTTATEITDFNSGKMTIGVAQGYIFDAAVREALPKAKLRYYDSRELAMRGLLAGEVDAVAEDEASIRAMLRSTDAFAMIDGYLTEDAYAFVFPKTKDGEELAKEYSSFIQKKRNLGELAELEDKWFGKATDNKQSEDLPKAPAGGRTLNLAFYDTDIPFSYVSAGRPVGFDIDVAIAFCREKGYGLNATGMEFNEMLDSIEQGTYDFGCGSVTVSEARGERFTFGEPDYYGGVRLVVSATVKNRAGQGVLNRLADSFSVTFLQEGRGWLFLGGIFTTILVTLLAVVVGTPIGMIAYAASRRGHLIVRMVVKALVWIIQGVPALMIIMSLYYAFYRDLKVGGILAGVIGFALSFGNDLYGNLSYHAKQLNDGKTEEDYRLYAIQGDAFFKTLLSAERTGIAFGFRESALHLLKMTSVLGFIAVQDMTKVMEIIRTESYEQVMILTATTIAYFILIKAAGGLLSRIRYGAEDN